MRYIIYKKNRRVNLGLGHSNVVIGLLKLFNMPQNHSLRGSLTRIITSIMETSAALSILLTWLDLPLSFTS